MSTKLSENPHIVTECCVIYNNKVLIQRRGKNQKNFPNFLTFPGGHVDVGEDILTCTIREIREETEVIINPEEIKLRACLINYHKDKGSTWVVSVFTANISKLQDTISSEEGVTEWMDISVFLKEEIFPPLKVYLEHIFNNKKGILYMSAEYDKGEIVNMTSRLVDATT